jgi:hypothetical protein
MTSYLVQWEIDIDAYDEVDAAMDALLIMQDRFSEARYFKVIEQATGKMTDVDLADEDSCNLLRRAE